MESSKNGTVQQYLGSLMNEYSSSLNKLNALKISTPETIEMLAQIYNSSTEQKSSNQPSAVKPSSFGTSNAAIPTQNPFGAGMFGTSNNNNQSTMSTSNIFGAQASNASSFPQSSSMFGSSNDQQKASFSFAQPKPSIFGQSPSLFGATQSQPQAPQSASIFGSPQNQTTEQQSSIFGGQSNIFGQSPFASSSLAPPTASQTSIFSNQATVQSPLQSQNMFTSMQTQPPQQQSIFGASSTNIFQQPSSPFGQVQAVQPQQSSQNIFGGSMLPAQPPVQSVAPQNIFGIQQQPQQNILQQPATGSSIFSMQQQQPATSMPAPPSFAGNPFQQQMAPPVSESAYSRLEDLTQEELHAFQGDEFVLGQIPLKPPAQNLCQ